MEAALLRIDPSLPLCWETTETLRVGFDRAEVRLHHPSSRAQRFISLLRRGIPSTELAAASRKSGLPARERASLLETLAPVLQRAPLNDAATPASAPAPLLAVVLGDGGFARALRFGLLRAGVNVADEHRADRREGAQAFTVIVERFAGSAANAQHLLIDETPHLPVILSDRSMTIGPLVLTPGAPCLSCVELHGAEHDPLRSTLAAQLFGVRPGSETIACAEFAAALCCSLIRQWRRGMPELRDARLRFPVQGGVPGLLPEVERCRPHRDCGCVGLSLAQTA